MTFLETGLILSLAVCLAGLAWRVRGWFRSWPDRTAPGRSQASPTSATGALKALLLDVVLLGRTARQSPYRWVAHGLILLGFTYLLLFHALAGIVSENLFHNYLPTLDPWRSLRNLAGLMVLAGLLMAFLRRLSKPRLRRLSHLGDWALLLLLGAIILSGFFLEAGKIISPAVFERMVQEYWGSDDPAEIAALQVHWAREQGTVFGHNLADDAATLSLGAELSADNCLDCHGDLKTAFVSLRLARFMARAAPLLERLGAQKFLYYFHLSLCFLGLAALPWSKLVHPLTTPLNLMIRGGRQDSRAGRSVAGPVRRGLGSDACTHCGQCGLRCSVAPAHTVLGNPDILPSERLVTLKRFRNGKLSRPELERLNQGLRTCTECLRCTRICPSGIDLQEMWAAARPSQDQLSQEIRQKPALAWASEFKTVPGDGTAFTQGLVDRAEVYQACIQCTTCTSVCPVVALSRNPARELDLTPQQIVNLLRMGLKELALGTGMVWSCTTCYQCQEHCPRSIPVGDALGELRHTAQARLDLPGRKDRG